MERKTKISKLLSYILRHNPFKFNLKLDAYGYADIDDILQIINERFTGFTIDMLLDLVKNDAKGRFEISNNKIRATYGHSVAVKLPNLPVEPPRFLYHGTSEEALDKILNEGFLKPMQRQFVHLSQNKEDAFRVGLRHTKKPIILEISAHMAYLDGIEFFRQKNTYLARFIPKEYIRCYKG